MDWKADLVRKLDQLKPEDFDSEGRVDIVVPLSAPASVFLAFVASGLCVNQFPVSWVGPGHLMLMMIAKAERISDEMFSGTLCFVFSRDNKFNEVRIEDVLTGRVTRAVYPIYREIDLMSL